MFENEILYSTEIIHVLYISTAFFREEMLYNVLYEVSSQNSTM
jgi:hypothetical protein